MLNNPKKLHNPNILVASQVTFDQFAIFILPPDESSEDSDANADDDWKNGGISPKLKDTGLLMGGYICNDFSVAFHIDDEIEKNTFQLRYIEWTATEESVENNV